MADNQAEASLLDKLRQRAEVGRSIAARPGLTRGPVRMWTGSVRHLLGQMFGLESATVAAWPTPQTLVPEGRFHETLLERVALLELLIESICASAERSVAASGANRVFIGHGRSPLWRELKDFLADRLSLSWDEFNRESAAGIATSARLEKMLSDATFAFLIMTAEDEHSDATVHARENVVHEVGLFQGKLGMQRAIILREDGCQVFSNIHGLTYIGFPRGRIGATFEEIRRVLERERIIGD
jgi:hypothetical protein